MSQAFAQNLRSTEPAKTRNRATPSGIDGPSSGLLEADDRPRQVSAHEIKTGPVRLPGRTTRGRSARSSTSWPAVSSREQPPGVPTRGESREFRTIRSASTQHLIEYAIAGSMGAKSKR